MPEYSEGWVSPGVPPRRSPLAVPRSAFYLSLARRCHKWPEEESRAQVYTIQDRTFKLRNIAMDALVQLIGDIKSARTAGRTDTDLAPALDFHRKAQFYLDFIEAENSMGFHAPQEAARILAESIDFSRKGQNALRTPATATR